MGERDTPTNKKKRNLYLTTRTATHFCIFRFFVSFVSRGEKHTHTESGKILHLTTHATTKWEKFCIFNNFFLLQVEVEKNRKLVHVEVRNT